MTVIRFINVTVVAALVLAAVFVYRIKFEATKQATQVGDLRDKIREEHDQIAALRAEWAELDNPNRIQHIVLRHLSLRPIDASQLDTLDHLPARPPRLEDSPDPIAAIIENVDPEGPTGGIRAPAQAR
jgi:cell division protein FtsL